MHIMESYLECHIKTIIQQDPFLRAQFSLLTKTVDRLGCEAHVKGGFCRDIILNILSKEAGGLTQNSSIPFDKEIKDIDIATNADAEEFAKALYGIAESDGLNPIDLWNNGEKTDKGKNISVWCVKLFKGVEPLDIVHFRTDSYDPQTGRVEIVDVGDSFSDDFRRDIPWPSIRINDMKLIDYFGVLDRMNRGEFIITTPPKKEHNNLINVFNPMIHHETVERILRLFKFITTPYDRGFAFAFDTDVDRFTRVSDSGFTLDPDIERFYTSDDLSIEELELRREILENLVKWRNNGLLANVFNSISSAVARRPYHFVKFLHDFRILDILFDSNHNVDVLLSKTRILEQSLDGSKLSKPYAIFGFGCRNYDLLQKVMGLFSIDKTTIRLARVFQNDALLDSNDMSLDKKTQIIISEIYDAHHSSYESELREFYMFIGKHIGCEFDKIPDLDFVMYFEDMRKRQIFRPILVDFLLCQRLDSEHHIRSDQFESITDVLKKCLEARLDGVHYDNYPKIQKIVESNCLHLNKAESKKIKKIIYDLKSEIIDRIENTDNIFAMGKLEAHELWSVTFRL